MTATAGPIGQAERIGALDVLRGVAVCGILLMNIPAMGLSWDWSRPPLPAKPNADWIALTIQNIGFEGSMRGLFTLLFGAGMMVMLRRADDDATSPPVQAYLTRCFGLMLLGVANFALFLWPGEILFNYGVCGLALLLFRRASIRVLLTAAAALLVSMTVFFAVEGFGRAEMLQTAKTAEIAQKQHKTLTKEQTAALEARTEALATIHPDKAAQLKERNERTTSPAVFIWSTKKWVDYNFGKYAMPFAAESLAAMLIGVALFRMNILSGARSLRFYLTTAAVGYGIGLAIRGGYAVLQWRAGFEPAPLTASLYGLLYEAGRVPTTFGLLGLVMVLYKTGAIGFLTDALTAIGRMALTNYIGQSVITSVLFYGFGYFNHFGFAQLMGICVLVWIFQGIVSLLWLQRYEMGPAEWALRSLTYGAWKPLARTQPLAGRIPAAAE
jgi:uncharacterized protein